MKTLFSALLLCIAIHAHSQSKTFDKLTQRMITAFEKADTGGFYRAIGFAAITAFDPRSAAFLDVWKPIEEEYPEASRLDIMKQITDSVMRSFYNGYLLKKMEKDFAKYRNVLEADFNYICPCISPRVKNGYTGQDINRIIKRCDDSLYLDKSYTKKMNEEIRKNPDVSNEKRWRTISVKYLVLKCRDFYENSIDYVLNVNMQQYLGLDKIGSPYFYKRPIGLYQNKMTDSLALLFPDYKKYEADIKNVIALGNPSPAFIALEGPLKANDTKGSKTILLFTLKGGTIIINGKISLSYTKTVPIKLLNYIFTPASQLLDKEFYIEKIEREIDDSFTPYYKNN